ncbi:MAG: DUF4190 domain-containing protein [archaeon]
MVDKKDLSLVSYILGILSIVFAFFNSLAGLVIGIVGFTQSKNQKDDLSKKAKKLNKIGIILSAVLFIIQVAVTAYLTTKQSSFNFPLA